MNECMNRCMDEKINENLLIFHSFSKLIFEMPLKYCVTRNRRKYAIQES